MEDDEQSVIVGYDPQQDRYVFVFEGCVEFEGGQAFSLPKSAIESAKENPIYLDFDFGPMGSSNQAH